MPLTNLLKDTIRLVTPSPSISPSAKKLIDDFENRFQLTVPSSLREWYLFPALANVVDDPQGFCETLPLSTFCEQFAEVAEGKRNNVEFIVGGYGATYIQLDGSEDPPTWENDDDTLPRKTFSTYIQNIIWSYRIGLGETLYCSTTVNQDNEQECIQLGPQEYEFLRKHYCELAPDSYELLNGKTQTDLRFYEDGQRIEVSISNGDPSKEICHGPMTFVADSHELFLLLFDRIKGLHNSSIRINTPDQSTIVETLSSKYLEIQFFSTPNAMS